MGRKGIPFKIGRRHSLRAFAGYAISLQEFIDLTCPIFYITTTTTTTDGIRFKYGP